MVYQESQIRRLGKQDVGLFQQLILLFQEVFEMDEFIKAEESHLQKLLENNSFIAFVIILENEIIGGLTAYELTSYYSESSEAYIYDIAINQTFKRQGLGKKLLSSLMQYCNGNNIKVMFVETNEEDQHAVDFYYSTGGQAEKVIHFNYLLNKETKED